MELVHVFSDDPKVIAMGSQVEKLSLEKTHNQRPIIPIPTILEVHLAERLPEFSKVCHIFAKGRWDN